MSPENEASGSNRRVQSLLQICQRVAGNNIESISSLGELPFSLVSPILERCSPEQLLRMEDASTHLKKDTEELWRSLCARTYPTMMERHEDTIETVPDSWRSHFFVLRKAEAKRLEEVGSRIRSQRREAEERKKEREVKFTDRMPPQKRSRGGWNMPAQPKSLFQKTRSEASKMQKNIYNSRMIPPMPKGKDYRTTGPTAGSSLLLPPQQSYSNRVSVNTVIRRPMSSTARSSGPCATPNAVSPQPIAPSPTNSSAPIEQAFPKPSSTAKKDPMASLFVPKHRAYSQRMR
ncbi:hypothetical protein BT96DRAFT_872059 [Gymnopus androsaceus JB14]|uniref:Elongin-A n=1 Tax=Gymnopus androsaceus JB14 TaxID=1447944 RepID=A0A6A4IKJ2_9AGAR|nr:hypothetical protein BT96DRAFT_872059 [Gymnopus androsaceus JB14]